MRFNITIPSGGQGRLLVTGAATLALSLAYSIYYFTKSPSSQSNGDELLPALTEEEVAKIMNKLFDNLKHKVTQLLQTFERVKQQIQQSGQEIDEKHLLKSFILPQYETLIGEIQTQLLYDNNIEEYELEDAVNYYIKHGNVKLTSIRDTIRTLYIQFGGDLGDVTDETDDNDTPGGVKEVESLTFDSVVSIVEEIVTQSTNNIQHLLITYKAKNGMYYMYTYALILYYSYKHIYYVCFIGIPTSAEAFQDFQMEIGTVMEG